MVKSISKIPHLVNRNHFLPVAELWSPFSCQLAFRDCCQLLEAALWSLPCGLLYKPSHSFNISDFKKRLVPVKDQIM